MSFVSARGLALSSRFGVATGLLAVVALSSGCPDPEPNERKPSLLVAAADASLLIGETSTITVTSKGADGKGNTDAVSVTVTKAAGDEVLAGGIGDAADALTEGPLSLTPDDKGVATFVVGCTGEGTLTLTFATAAVDKAKTLDVRCRVPDINVSVSVAPFQDCRTLQADGNSSCRINVTVRDEDGALVEDFPVTVRVDSVSNIITNDATLTNGIDDVLAIDADEQALSSNLAGLRTGVTGQPGEVTGETAFFIVSPETDLQETINFTVTAGATSQSDVVIIGPFNDLSNLDVSASPASITSGDQTTITLKAIDADTTAANAGVVVLTAPAGFEVTPDPSVTDTGNRTFSVILDENGERDVVFTAPDVDRLTSFTFSGTFRSINESAERSDTADVSVNIAGAVTPNVEIDRTLIKALGEPSKAILRLSATQDGNPFNGVSATVRVKLETQSIIAIVDPNDDTARVDAVTIPSFTNGEFELTIVADSSQSRGTGELEIEIDIPDQDPFIPDNVVVVVDRDPILQSIVYIGSQPADGVIGVQGSPIATTAVLTFQLLDDNAEPIAGLPVSFAEIASDPDVTVDGGLVTDGGGLIKAIVNAGLVAGPVVVEATANFGGRTLQASSDVIAIVGGLPNSEHSSLICESTAQFTPFETNCSVSLADRFTNFTRVGNVQFRAEGGSIDPVGTAGAAKFAFGNPGPGSADVRGWSYSNITNLPAAQRARFAGCFDNTTNTACDIIGICTDADPIVKAFCPLRPNATGTNNCTTEYSAAALDALETQGSGEAAIAYEIENFTGIDLVAGVNVQQQVADYTADQRKCGVALSCLQANSSGLLFDSSDNCPVNLGCFDFSATTECPQDGLLDIMVSFNGEEGFDDENGNGVFDNNEDFVDFPEPFLDKNSSCSFDDLNESTRLTAGQKIQESDLFVDSDNGDDEFGFVINGKREETNKTYDLNTEIFLKTTIVELAGGRLQLGEVGSLAGCGADLNGAGTCSPTSNNDTSACTQTALGDVFKSNCRPQLLADGATQGYVYRWTDANGNCPSVDLADSATVESEGPIELVAGEVALDNNACGVTPGAINAANSERPWCEEHAGMGSPLIPFSIAADCEGEDGPTAAKLTFSLGELDPVEIAFTVDCPAAG